MIIVFDAQCLLCSAWVQFLLRHDKAKQFRFASIQGAEDKQLLKEAGLQIDRLETLLLVDETKSYQHTDAILRVLHTMGWPWRAVGVTRIIPASLRDRLYRWIARNRYQLFGRADQCFMPKAGEVGRFLD